MPLNMKEELSLWLHEDVVEFISRQHAAGKTYREIAADLSKSGWFITAKNIMNWVSYSKQKQKLGQQ